jgi:hypothetical protein
MDLETIFPEQSHPVAESKTSGKARASLFKKKFPPTHCALRSPITNKIILLPLLKAFEQ